MFDPFIDRYRLTDGQTNEWMIGLPVMLNYADYAYLLKVKNLYWLELVPLGRDAICMDLEYQPQKPEIYMLLLTLYSKTCVKQPLSNRPKMVSKMDYRLMQVKSIVECSKGSIMQYFWPSLSYQLSLRPIFCLILSGRFTQVLLYALNGFFLLVWYNKLGIVSCIYQGATGYSFKKYCIFFSKDQFCHSKQCRPWQNDPFCIYMGESSKFPKSWTFEN